MYWLSFKLVFVFFSASICFFLTSEIVPWHLLYFNFSGFAGKYFIGFHNKNSFRRDTTLLKVNNTNLKLSIFLHFYVFVPA